jgi:NADH-quinone oxidoreductase subunit M
MRCGSHMFGPAADWTALVRGPAGPDAGGFEALGLLMAGFVILLGAVPGHWWLAEALAEGETPVALLLVGVFNSLGGYALLRVATATLAQTASPGLTAPAWTLAVIAAVGMVYAAAGAWGQNDLKRRGAFLAVGLAAFVVAGAALGSASGLQGAAHLLVCRGAAVGMMLLAAGMVETRAGHGSLGRLGGLGGYLPGLAAWSAVAYFGAAGMPGSGTFVGITLVILGAFERQAPWLGVTAVAALAALIGCAASTHITTFMGPPRPEHSNVARLSVAEKWILLLLGLAVVGLGILDF